MKSLFFQESGDLGDTSGQNRAENARRSIWPQGSGEDFTPGLFTDRYIWWGMLGLLSTSDFAVFWTRFSLIRDGARRWCLPASARPLLPAGQHGMLLFLAPCMGRRLTAYAAGCPVRILRRQVGQWMSDSIMETAVVISVWQAQVQGR